MVAGKKATGGYLHRKVEADCFMNPLKSWKGMKEWYKCMGVGKAPRSCRRILA